MNKFPNPPPDRRTNKNIEEESKNINIISSTQIPHNNSNNSITSNIQQSANLNNISSSLSKNKSVPKSSFTIYNNYSSNHSNIQVLADSIEKDDFERMRSVKTMDILKMKHIEDMRNNILSYKILNDKKMFLSSNVNNLHVNKCNIILFGPSGSGKSSFINTLYRAVYGTRYLPPEATSKLLIKETDQNEGTLCFTRLHLKEEAYNSSGIVVCDTRGHIWMNEEEKEQFKVIIEGKVKEDVQIVQNKDRNAFLLWEFWKKDSELFPQEIFNAKEPGLDTIPHNIVLVFDGSIDETIDRNDEKFYRELVQISLHKGYTAVHVILTRIDLFEKYIFEKNKILPLSERTSIMNNLKDQKIEKVIDVLGVKRSNIHFLENYHSDLEDNLIEIDYQALKTLGDLISLSEQFILLHINKNATCFAKCF